MPFDSLEFMLFFTALAGLYFATPQRMRWALLLAASYAFYMAWQPAYALLLLASTAIDYTAGRAMGRLPHRKGRTKYLVLSLAGNLGLLFTFKYYAFFSGMVTGVLGWAGFAPAFPHLDLLLPIGISFYTFQTLSYAIEVYRGRQPPEKHFGIFALYVSFFPQLVAGPIERPQNLLPQFRQPHAFDYTRAVAGLRLILWGLFKKVVVADRLAVFVDAVYGQPAACPGPVLLLATICFAYQIYCDFSGYSDIAIGVARVMGYRLSTNFDRPYHARSLPEFWRRWHISLSAWFRDYLYIPLGGNRARMGRWGLNVIAVFALCGLWHGANTTFLCWGLLHAGYLIVGRCTARPRAAWARILRLDRSPRLRDAWQRCATFVLVLLAWVLFRAESMTQAAGILRGFFAGWAFCPASPAWPALETLSTALCPGLLTLCLGNILVVEGVEFCQQAGQAPRLLALRPLLLRWAIYLLLVLSVLNLGSIEPVPFIYFQF